MLLIVILHTQEVTENINACMASASVSEYYAVYVYRSTKCVAAINTMLQADVQIGYDVLLLLHKMNGCQ